MEASTQSNGGVSSVNNNNNENTSTNNVLTPSFVNHFRITACADRLAMHVRAAPKNDAVEFFNLCLSLARGIDYAIANKEVPSRTQELPSLLKQICQMRSDPFLQAAILVLMISVKTACDNKWFSDQDSKDLYTLQHQILSGFCSTMNFNPEPNNYLPIITTIMSRFYPRMKLGEILASLEIKSGYGTYVHDFQISKDMKPAPEEKIRLLIAQIDNIETSSCLITPMQANFLLNGKGVERRTNISMDSGPQMPTPVYSLLKYGTNLLQAVGDFNGRYIVVIAFMSIASSTTSNHTVLQDYVGPTLSMTDSDSEVIEGPFRISLNCPLSFARVKLPVKGHMCNHYQCFDYENYMEVNSRLPSWKCPCCNQHLNFTDIRIDQNMVKVLKEVGENVHDVLISSDGSWKVVIGNENSDDKSVGPSSSPTASPVVGPTESSPPPPPPSEGLDLTVDDYGTEYSNINIPSTSIAKKELNSNSNSNSNPNRATSYVQDDFWSGIFLPTTNESVGPTRELSPFNKYRRFSPMSRNVTRVPNAIQALPAQNSNTFEGLTSQFSRNSSSSSSSSSRVPATPSLQQYQQALNDNNNNLSPGMMRSPYSGGSSGSNRASVIPRSVNQAQYTSPVENNIPPPPPGFIQEEENWRPTGRMRGALTGREYADALQQFTQAQRPVLNTNSLSRNDELVETANRVDHAQVGSHIRPPHQG